MERDDEYFLTLYEANFLIDDSYPKTVETNIADVNCSY